MAILLYPATMNENKHTVAVVGGVGIWGRRYLQAYVERDDCEVVALVDTARQRCEAFAKQWNIPWTCDTVKQLLDHTVPDIVSIILPVAHSPAAVLACADAGVKVISCEKPIAISLADADRMVKTCQDRGIPLGCSTVHWGVTHLPAVAAWVRAGNIGRLTSASMPVSLANEVSGGGCAELTQLRLITGMEVQWVEGWAQAPDAKWTAPPGESADWLDSGAHGRLGLSGGIVADVPPPPKPTTRENRPDAIVLNGEDGQVRLSKGSPILTQGRGAAAKQVEPDFLRQAWVSCAPPVVDRLVHALEEGRREVSCSGHDLRQALEIAIALKLSALEDHRRVGLPLQDRSLKIFPSPYRLTGGDAMGWENTEYKNPPSLSQRF